VSHTLSPVNPSRTYADPAQSALVLLETLVVEGLEHGHFEYALSCELGTHGRRLLIIKAGKSHNFTIEPGNIPR
jgi:hypothetical protein